MDQLSDPPTAEELVGVLPGSLDPDHVCAFYSSGKPGLCYDKDNSGTWKSAR